MCQTCAWLQSERREHCASPVPLARCCIFYSCCYRQQQTHILTVPILYMVTVARLCGCLPSDFPVHPPPSFSLCVLGDVGGRCFKVLSAKLLKSSQLHRETVDLQVPVTLSSEEVYSTGCSPLYSSLSLFFSFLAMSFRGGIFDESSVRDATNRSPANIFLEVLWTLWSEWKCFPFPSSAVLMWELLKFQLTFKALKYFQQVLVK